MAHADYNCCAICDSKMDYNGGAAETKNEICISCIERSIELGHPIIRPEQIISYLTELSDSEALTWLHAMGFDLCYYGNDIDNYLINRGFILKEGGYKWGKKLKPLE